jgi:hypothetical protein
MGCILTTLAIVRGSNQKRERREHGRLVIVPTVVNAILLRWPYTFSESFQVYKSSSAANTAWAILGAAMKRVASADAVNAHSSDSFAAA